jgi:hypothetical protein
MLWEKVTSEPKKVSLQTAPMDTEEAEKNQVKKPCSNEVGCLILIKQLTIKNGIKTKRRDV